MAKVSILAGNTRIESGSKVSSHLSVIIPQGMTGKQLAAWKRKNEATIVAMVESGNFGAIDSGSTDDVVGDRRARQ